MKNSYNSSHMERFSINRPLLFSRIDYSYWETRMTVFEIILLQSLGCHSK